MDEKNTAVKPAEAEKPAEPAESWAEDMKRDMEEYIEEQGIYIRQ